MRLLFLFLMMMPVWMQAQDPCELSQKFTDSLGFYVSTKSKLVYERNFAGSSTRVYFSLSLSNRVPSLDVQFIDRSKEFMVARCLDKSSRMFIQLASGKIVTLMHIGDETCGSSISGEDGFNFRVLGGYFVFSQGSLQELETSPVTLIRIRYATDTVDYIIRSELDSELDGVKTHPEKFFIETLPCLLQ